MTARTLDVGFAELVPGSNNTLLHNVAHKSGKIMLRAVSQEIIRNFIDTVLYSDLKLEKQNW